MRNEVSNEIRVKSVPNTCQKQLIFVYLSVKCSVADCCFFRRMQLAYVNIKRGSQKETPLKLVEKMGLEPTTS